MQGKPGRAEDVVELLGRSARDWWDHVHLKKDNIVAPRTSDEVFDTLAAEYTFVRHDNEVRDQLWGLRKADQEYLTDFFHLAAPTKIPASELRYLLCLKFPAQCQTIEALQEDMAMFEVISKLRELRETEAKKKKNVGGTTPQSRREWTKNLENQSGDTSGENHTKWQHPWSLTL